MQPEIGPFVKRCVLAALLCFGQAGAIGAESSRELSLERACQAEKMKASTLYHRCLTDAMRETILKGGAPSDARIDGCDRRFDRAFDRAESRADCNTPGDAMSARNAIKNQVLETYTTVVTTSGPCAVLNVEDGYANCGFSESQSSIDLTAMLDQINSDPDVTTLVNENTTIWILAWGGHGGYGSGPDGTDGHGADGGYAQMTTTVGQIQADYGVTTLYYYLGNEGDPRACASGGNSCGGNGGTATIVASEDLTAASHVPESILLLVAAGGGGGGAGRGKIGFDCNQLQGSNGGAGAVAISEIGAVKKVSGDDGQDKLQGYSGQGGGSGGNGGTAGGAGNGNAKAGDDEFAPIGGIGGSNTATSVGFLNVPAIVETAGHGGAGGSPGDNAPGGAGGGGWAAGGGGVEGTYQGYNNIKNLCRSGAGGGGSSLARASTRSCTIAPTTAPKNPTGSTGHVRISINLGGC